MAFKEWALVCAELGSGRQSIILRKGGIAEGREGFRFQHEDFLLFPTLFHEQLSKLKLPGDTPLPSLQAGEHTLKFRLRVEWTRDLTDWEQIRRLDRFHVWREEVIRERFEYDDKRGVSLAFVRAYQLAEPLVFADAPKYGGCRSWVQVPDAPQEAAPMPLLEERLHRQREAEILGVLEQS